MYCGSKVRYFYWEIDSFYYSRHRAVVNIPTQTLIISPWLVLCKMIISQLELKPPVVQLAVLCALTLYAMRLGTEDSFFLLWIRCSSLCGKPWGVHKTTSYASKWEGRGGGTGVFLKIVDMHSSFCIFAVHSRKPFLIDLSCSLPRLLLSASKLQRKHHSEYLWKDFVCVTFNPLFYKILIIPPPSLAD